MKKTIKLALAALPVTLLGLNAHAQSQVGIYGTADIYAGDIRNSGGTAAQGHTKVVNSGGMTTSFLGFRGSEDLGDGLKAVFNLETFVRLDLGQIGRNDTDPYWARLAVVGVEAPWGGVTLGRHVTPYSLATTNFTPFVGSTTFSTAFGHIYRNNLQGDTRFNNSIRYRSPVSSGLIADLVWSFGQEIQDGPNRHQNQAFDGTVRYAEKDWSVVFGTRQINLNTNDNGRDQKAYMVGGSYDFKLLQIFAQVHDIKETFNNSKLDVKRRTYELGAAVPVGIGAIWATYARSTIADNSPTTSPRRTGWALGYDHPLSKRTDLYAATYADKFEAPKVEQQIVGFGIRHRF